MSTPSTPTGNATRREGSATERPADASLLAEPALSQEGEADAGTSASSRVGQPDGHGHFGVLDEDEDGLLCHECGWRGAHLGLHANRAHGMTALAYKLDHGLRRSKGLVVAAVHEKLAERSAEQLARRSRFLANRDTRKATAARLASGRPLSAAGAAASAAAAGRHRGSRRAGIVVVCQECDVEFCPLRGASKRRFCSRSCASRHNRRIASQQTGRLTPPRRARTGTDESSSGRSA